MSPIQERSRNWKDLKVNIPPKASNLARAQLMRDPPKKFQSSNNYGSFNIGSNGSAQLASPPKAKEVSSAKSESPPQSEKFKNFVPYARPAPTAQDIAQAFLMQEAIAHWLNDSQSSSELESLPSSPEWEESVCTLEEKSISMKKEETISPMTAKSVSLEKAESILMKKEEFVSLKKDK